MKPSHLLRTTAAAAGCAGSAMACSVLLDWSAFTADDAAGGSSDGSTHMAEAGAHRGDGQEGDDGDSGGEMDASPLTPCGPDKLCAPPVPSVPGWQGPYALFNGAPDAASPCDPSTYESMPVFTGFEGLTATSPTCSCTCSNPQGTTCSTPEVTFYSDTCVTPCLGSPTPLTACVAAPMTCPTFMVGNSMPSGGECTASPPPAIPPVAWTIEGQACKPQTPDQGSCGAGEFCLSEGSGNFCIMQAGDMPCPAGDYSFSYVYYGAANDTRGCAACSCGEPSGASCSFPPTVIIGFPYLDPTCSTVPTGPLALNECTTIPTVKAVELKATPTLTAGSCAPSGGQAMGTATASGPTTFCCTH